MPREHCDASSSERVNEGQSARTLTLQAVNLLVFSTRTCGLRLVLALTMLTSQLVDTCLLGSAATRQMPAVPEKTFIEIYTYNGLSTTRKYIGSRVCDVTAPLTSVVVAVCAELDGSTVLCRVCDVTAPLTSVVVVVCVQSLTAARCCAACVTSLLL